MAKWKDSKIVSFVPIFDKGRFEQIYKTSLWNETVRQITEVFCKKVFLEISQNLPKTPVLESLFPVQVFSDEFCGIF